MGYYCKECEINECIIVEMEDMNDTLVQCKRCGSVRKKDPAGDTEMKP